MGSADTAQITPAWLTATLRGAGRLPQGEVVALAQQPNDAFNSAIVHSTVSYSDTAPATAPQHLLLKRNRDTPWAVEAALKEVLFYQLVAPFADQLPMLLPAYAAHHDPMSSTSYLLLPDVSATHVTPTVRQRVLALDGVPNATQLADVVDALAQLHAYWWEHPLLGTGLLAVDGRYSERAAYAEFISEVTNQWARFDATEGDWFPADLRALYAAAVPLLPALWERYLAGRVLSCTNLTLSSGDCYFAQFLCARVPGGPTYIIDWHSPRADFAALDLTYLFATLWTPEQRRAEHREDRLLHRYYQTLRTSGVSGYSWKNLLSDYQLMLIFMIFLPVWDQTNGSPRAYWWPKLQCLTSAFHDWRCDELLTSS